MAICRVAAAAMMLLVSAGAAESQNQGEGRDRGRQEASPARRTDSQTARPQERGQAQGGQKPKAERGQAQQGGQKPKAERGQGQGGQGRQSAQGQQRGQGEGAQARNPGRQGGQSQAASPGRSGANRGSADDRPVRRVSRPVRLDRLPERLRPMASSGDHGQRVAAVAVARGLEHNALPVNFTVAAGRVRVVNGRDDLLLDLSDDEARRLGYWDVRRLDPRGVRDDAPAFCRSGAGHPVWGREWCMNKGFGLGSSNDWLWGRHLTDDIEFRRYDDRLSLDRGSLLDVLGAVVFDRLALHALALGLADPLQARWIGEPTGPRVMLLDSGSTPVAELVDWDRDGRVDVMYVVSR